MPALSLFSAAIVPRPVNLLLRALLRSRAKKEGAIFSRVSVEALEKPCVTHGREMRPVGRILHSFGTHIRTFQVSDVPIDAQNAKILELSVRIIPYSGVVVRRKMASTGNSRIIRLFRGAQGRPFP